MQTVARWRPIGAVLVDSGAITQTQLDSALDEQRRSGRRLGEILIDSGAITWLALAHAIAEQAKDLDVPADDESTAFQGDEADGPTLTAVPISPPEPPVRPVSPPVVVSGDAETRLQTVEMMLKDRQRAFLELVSTAEALRKTVAKLEDELAARDAEIMRLRKQMQGAA